MDARVARHRSGLARRAALALVVAALSAVACPFSESCVCPAPGGRLLFPRLLASSPIASVSAGSTCTTEYVGSWLIDVATSTGETCVFTVELMDSARFRVTVRFAQLDPDGCCAGVYTVNGDPGYERLDGGGNGDGGLGS